jgi:hypothetical protein
MVQNVSILGDMTELRRPRFIGEFRLPEIFATVPFAWQQEEICT